MSESYPDCANLVNIDECPLVYGFPGSSLPKSIYYADFLRRVRLCRSRSPSEGGHTMASSHTGPRQRRRADSVHKPRGVLNPRVKRVGPEHFGIVAIDCAKHRSKWMFTDFYGTILAPPTVVEHQEPAFRRMVDQINRL